MQPSFSSIYYYLYYFSNIIENLNLKDPKTSTETSKAIKKNLKMIISF